MPSKKKSGKQLLAEIKKEEKRLKKMKLVEPELFRRCGDVPCCQSRNQDGSMCNRPAMTDRTFIRRMKCCYLCWQHALTYGVYGLYRLAKLAGTLHLDWDSYCALYPEECNQILKKINS